MAQPTPYDREFNFQNYQSVNPTSPLPGDQVDAELNAIKITADQVLSNLALVQRDDGGLANGIVTQDSFAAGLSVGFTLRGAWAAPVNYVTGDGVSYNNTFYRALSSHLSVLGQTPNIRTDLWQFVLDFNDFAPAVIADGGVTTAKLADGILTADVAGRAKMADKFVTLAKMDDLAAGVVLGRATGAGTGVPTALTAAQQRVNSGALAFAFGAPIATTSGTSHDFTGISSGCRRITVSYDGLSTNGTNDIIVQLGDAGGVEATGYVGSGGIVINSSPTNVAALSTGFSVSGVAITAATAIYGSLELTLINSSTNLWAARGASGTGALTFLGFVAGTKALSQELDRIRLTTVGGTATFDAGSVNIQYFYV